MRIGTIHIEHRLDCGLCDATVSGGTRKRAYFWFILHMGVAHRAEAGGLLATIRALWQLWHWQPGSAP